MLRSHARNATALVSLIISVAALAAAHPFPDPPVPDPCDGFSDANGNFGYPACDRDNVSRFYNPITDTPSFDSVCWHGVTTTSGGSPSLVYPAFSGFNNLNANLFWGPQPGDYPPRKLDLAAGSSPLISSDAPSRRGPWPTLERPTIADTVDLITGQPLLQEIDFELPFGSALFRHTRTYAGISPHSWHDWQDFSETWENHAPEPDSTEAMWDWNGYAWMMGEAPLFLMDARYWGWSPNPERPRCYFVPDAHHAIPFDFDESNQAYVAPQWFDARLDYAGGDWNAGENRWTTPPTEYFVYLHAGAIKYTIKPLYRQDVAYDKCGTGGTTGFDLHNQPDTDRNLYNNEWAPSGETSQPGLGIPYLGLVTSIEDRNGNRIAIEYCDHQQEPYTAKECDNEDPERDLWFQHGSQKGQIRRLRLFRAGSNDPQWTLLYVYRTFRGSLAAGVLHGGEVTTTDPADLQPDPENLREINALSSRAYASRQRALDSIYVYEGEVATPIVDNLPAHSLTIPMTAFEAAYRAASFGEDLANQAGLDDAQELTRDEVFDALTAAMNLDVADGSPTMPADLGWEVPANWTRRVKYLYTEPSFTQRSPEGDKVYNERNFFGSLSVRDSLVYGEPDEAAFYNMTWPGNDAGAMTEIAPMLIASRTDTRVEVTTAANTTETVTSTRHWLANYEMVDQGVSEEFFTRSPVIKSVWSSGTLALLGKTIDDAGVTASDDAKFARAHWPLGLLLVKEATEFPRVGDPESDEKLLLHQTADYTLRDWWAREDVSAAGAIGTPDGKNDDFYDDNGDFWKEAADAVATSSGGKQLRMDAGVGVFTDRRSGALRPRTYKVRKFIIMPGNREFSVGGSPGYLTAHPGGPISGTGGTGGLFLRNSIHHAPYVFYGAAGMIGEPSSDPSVIPFGQTGEGDFVPALGEPLWATIIDEYDGESKARTAITASLASIVASGNDIEIEKLPLTRRLVWMNAAGYVLKEQVWDVRSGELASDQGFITETDLDDYGRVLERRSPGWGSYANKDNRHDKGRIDVYGYDGDSREPSLVGMKQGTEGTVYYTTQVFRNTVRSDLIDATVQFTTPSTTALSSIPDLDNLPAGVVATRTEYILGTPLWDPEGGTSADPIPNSNPIYQKLDYGAAASSEPGGTPRRAFAAEIYNYGSNNDTPLVADQPMGALLWKGYGQVASPSGAAPGDEVFWDYTRYDDRGRVIATIVDAASGVNFGDSDQGFTEIPVPGYPLTQFSRQPAANDALRPALMLATLQWHSDLGTVKTKFPDGRFELTSYVCDDETSEVRKGLFVFENGAWRPVTSGGIQRYGGDAAEGGSIVTWPDNFQYFDGQIPASVIAEVEIENDSAGRPTEVSLSAGDAEGVTGQIEYDWFGLAARETAFDGTRTRKVTNLRGQLEMVWRGTKDKHALWGNLNNGEPDDNMILLEKNTYGTGVNDALKLVGVRRYRHAFTPTQAFGESGFAYFDDFGWLETHAYDWRGRDVLVRRYRESNGPNENPDVITTTATHLDHMDRAVLVAEYGGDLPSGAIDPTQAAAGAAPPSAAQVVAGGGGALLALTETIYDARGKVLTTRTYDPTDAAKYTESTTYADSRGSATWSRSPNAPVTIRVYDSQGREIRSTQLVGTLEIERTDTQRDTVGNAIRVVTRERVAGAGGDTLGENNSVRSYRFHWYDKSNRVIATLDAGTMNAANTHVDHGGGDRTRPDAPGDDPRELSSQDPQTQELLGLNTTWFGGLTGSASASKGLWAFELSFYDVKGNKARDIVCNRPGDAGDDRITDTRYDGFGQVVARVERTSADNATPPRTTYSKYQNGKVVAMGTNPDEDSADWINPTLGGFQKTEIEYGADIVVSPEPGILGTVSRNNGYIGLITFPSDEDTPPTSIAFTYYPDGLIATRSVRRGGVSEAVPEPLVTFGYGYDELSRLIEIRVWYPETLPPPGGRPVDRITRVEYAYDGAGRLTAATAYTTNPSTSAEEIVSQNVLAYDPMGRLLSEQQQHAGVVTSASPVVSYAWEQDTAKNIERLTRIVYPARVNPTGGPSARTIEFGFGSPDSTADLLSRVSTVTDVSASGALGQLAAYTYSGISRRVGASWGHGTSGTPAASYTTIATSGVGHSGLDAMGRLAALTVKNSAGSSTPLFEALYGYSPEGDLVTRRVTQAAIGGLSGGGADNTRSALFGHDRLGRLVEHEAGTLGADANGAPEITSLWRRSAWSMDTLGNLAGTPAGGGNPAAPGLVLEADRDGDSVLDVLQVSHDTARNNRLDEIARGDSITSVVDVAPVVNDRAGNVVCDDLYYYQYDAWNRLIQVRHKGSLEFDSDGNATSGTPGEWIVHYTYDALGRLIRRQLPHNLELEQVRIEEYFYDGVRRVSETLTTPLVSVGGGPIGGGGGGGGGSGETQTVTDREYVWAPPPSGYVDECVAQIDRTNAVRYVIQDASYDVVALVTPQTSGGNPQPSRVIAQYTWDPYGQVLTAEYAGLASTYNKLGHHGLFADRLDAGYQSATLAAGFVSSTHLPARIVYNVRNRTYEPSTQRWLQRDPNATGQVVLDAMLIARRATAAPGPVDIETAYQDGMSLYGYVGSSPTGRSDELGMFFGGLFGLFGGSSTAMELQTEWTQEVGDFGLSMVDSLESMFVDRMVDMELDLEWALDWSASDSDYSRSGQQLMVARSEWHESGGFAYGKKWAWNKNIRHHIATTYGAWGKKLKRYFKNAGLSMDNAANIMPVKWKDHKGRGHAEAYHELVEYTLDRRLRGIDPRVDKERYRRTLEEALRYLKDVINKDPTILRGK